jgi:hypothetical protein
MRKRANNGRDEVNDSGTYQSMESEDSGAERRPSGRPLMRPLAGRVDECENEVTPGRTEPGKACAALAGVGVRASVPDGTDVAARTDVAK